MRRIGLGLLGFLGVLTPVAYVLYGGGEAQGMGVITQARQPDAQVARRFSAQAQVAGEEQSRILFGDLHVHTTYSADAFMRSLPLLGGEGSHPAADACDFARFCSSLDFFAMTDHAETLTPDLWAHSKAAVRQCNTLAGEQAPDVIAFSGFEWTQVGATPEEHFGHKNVIFRHTDEARLPTRPIAARGLGAALRSMTTGGGNPLWLPLLPVLQFDQRKRYADIRVYMMETAAMPDCPDGDPRTLPLDCREYAETPNALFKKLDQWGFEALVIPHGTTWGFYTPPGYTWDKQIQTHHDPERQRLIEVFSGHGNSEQYRESREVSFDAQGAPVCPAPAADFEPCCHRAGELIRARCDDPKSSRCAQRVAAARRNYAEAGSAGHLTVPGASVEDWGDCGQCRDCFQPAFNNRPGGSAQYIMARGHFEQGKPPVHQTLGFMASSDNHSARPGTGYKEYARRKMTEATGPISAAWRSRMFGETPEPTPESVHFDREELTTRPGFRLVHLERQASFFLTGGLIAVHGKQRSRDEIWNAMQRREVYGTSGPRILLWFHLENHPGGRAPMGAELPFGGVPRFSVRAVGAAKQRPGCPDSSKQALGPERLAHLCADECHHPGDERHALRRLEIIRIRRQQRGSEPVGELIEDPWRTLPCDGPVCEGQFEDPDYTAGARDVLYYVRAVQEATPAVNASSLRCQGPGCPKVKPCYGDYRTSLDDDCLSDSEERAWSSPIFLQYDASVVALPVVHASDAPEQEPVP